MSDNQDRYDAGQGTGSLRERIPIRLGSCPCCQAPLAMYATKPGSSRQLTLLVHCPTCHCSPAFRYIDLVASDK